ncbi:DUF7507 domain-containing protein [Winogradskyella sp. PC D3.3]
MKKNYSKKELEFEKFKIKTKKASFLFVFLISLLFTNYVNAQARVYVNGSLEFGVPVNAMDFKDANFGWGGTFEAGVPVMSPWYTTHPVNGCTVSVGACHPVEIWGSGFLGTPATEGDNFVELNAYVDSMIYQNMYLVNGDVVTYDYRHRARTNGNLEQAGLVIEDQNENVVAAIHETTLPSSTSAWSTNQGTYTFTGTDGVYRLGFRALSSFAAGGGNLLDAVSVTLNPIIDLKYSSISSSCEGGSNGSIFLRVNGGVTTPTSVAFELIDPLNGTPFVSDSDITLTPVPNSNGTPVLTHTPGTNIYVVTIPVGNYDGGTVLGYADPINDEDGIQINVSSVYDGITEGNETFRFEIKPQNTNGATNNFVSTSSPVFGDTYYGATNDGFIYSVDFDGDGIPDACDLDDDNDGIPDTVETGGIDPQTDADDDGVPVYLDDDDSDPLVGDANGAIETGFDTDSDGTPDFLDLDSDGDGCSDAVEAGATKILTSNFQFPASAVGADGIPDAVQATSGADSGVIDYNVIGSNINNLHFQNASVGFACFPELGCPAEGFQVINNATPSQWQLMDLVTGDMVLVDDNSNHKINSIGYNVKDGRVWGASTTSIGKLTVTAKDGSGNLVTEVVTIPGIPTSFNSNVGDIDENGHYYFCAGSANANVRVIDLDPESVTYLQQINSFTVTNGVSFSDFAFHPSDGFLYAVTSNSDLLKINPNTGVHINLGSAGMSTASGYGAVFFDANGFFYVFNNSNGRVFRLDLRTDPGTNYDESQTILFSQGVASGNNDGARCAYAELYTDYGDAPDLGMGTSIGDYKTLLSDDGPRHTLLDFSEVSNTSSLMLGTAVTAESDALQNTDATGDQDDGMTWTSLTSAQSYTETIELINTTGESAYLNVWIDYNMDGDFDDADEQLINDQEVLAGTTSATINFTTPSYAISGDTFARVRLCSNSGECNTSTGPAAGGEVEDYLVNFSFDPSIEITKSSTYVDVNGDGVANVGDEVHYVFEVSNTGNVTVSNITVSDANAVVSGGPIDLTSGATDSTTFTAVHTLTQLDVDAGYVYNIATATGEDPSGDPVEDESEDPDPLDPSDPGYDSGCPDCTVTPIPQEPSIEITKSSTYVDVNGDGVANVGDEVHYVFEVSNTGNVTVSNITVSDANAVVSGGPIDLTPGATDSTTFTAVHTLTQSDVDAGYVYNIATATGEDPSGDPVEDESEDPDPLDPSDPGYDSGCPDCTVTPIPQEPSIEITKSGTYVDVNGDGVANVGDEVHYVFEVSNTGNVTVSNITVSDANAVVSGGPIDLTPGATDSTTFTAVHTLTQSDVDAGYVYNIATATGEDPSGDPVEDESEDPDPLDPSDPGYDPSCPDCTVTPIPQEPSIEITKSSTYVDVNGDGVANVGDEVHYVFEVSNTGNVTVSNITVSDANAVVSGGPIDLTSGATDSTTFTAVHTLTQSDVDAGYVYNIATATGEDPSGDPVEDESEDPDPLDPSDPGYDSGCPDCTVTPIPQEPSIEITKSGTYVDVNGDGVANVGDEVHYVFEVNNTGNVTVSNITVSDANAVVSGGPIDLTPGATDSTTFTAVHTLTQSDVDAGYVYNIATATGEDPSGDPVEDESEDPDPLDPSDPGYDPSCPDCTVTPIPQDPSIEITKSGSYVDVNGDGVANVGDEVHYVFEVSNTGNVTVSNITVSDANAVVSGGPIDLTPGATDSTTFTAVHTLTQSDVDAGYVYNIATATGEDPSGDPVEDESEDPDPLDPSDPGYDPSCPDCTVTPIPQDPSIEITKSGSYVDVNGDGVANVGDEVHYVFEVSNTGNVTVSNITVSDANAVVSGGPIDLTPGATDSTTFTAVHTLTQLDVDAGYVYNIATATGEDPSGDPVEDESEDPDPLDPSDPGYDSGCPDCTVTPIPQEPSIEITKSGSYVDVNGDGVANVGDEVHYVFEVSNTGNVTVSNITVSDVNAVVSGGPIDLTPGATDSTTFTAVHTLTQLDVDAGYVYNIATATGEDPSGAPVEDESEDPDPLDPSDPGYDSGCPDCTVTPIPQEPSIEITKSGTYVDVNGDGVANVGDEVHYVFEVSNTGNVTVSNITVSDANAVVSGGPIDLTPGATDSTTFTAVHTLTQSDVDAGYVYNIATATGEDPSGDPVEDESEDPDPLDPSDPGYDPSCPDCTVTPIPQEPSIEITKSGTYVDVNGDGVANVGDEVHYVFEVSNTGNVTVSNITVSDANAVVSGGPIDLTPGATDSTTFTAVHTLTQLDVDAGYVYNIATATGEDPSGAPVEDESEDPDPLDPSDPGYDPGCPDCTVIEIPNITNAINDINNTFVNTPVSGSVLTNDFDLEGNEQSITSNTEPENGTVVVNSDGTYTYTPNTGFVGTDTFTYVVCDNGNPQACDTATVTINVEPISIIENNVVVANDDAVITEVDTPIVISVLSNDFDPNGDAFSITSGSVTSPQNGVVTVNADGTIIYTPNIGYVGEDSFTYTICDDGTPQACDTATVYVTIFPDDGVNNTYAVDDAYFIECSSDLTMNLLDNDYDNEGDDQIVVTTPLVQPLHGTVIINPDGTFDYSVDGCYTGPDSFVYQVCDSHNPSACSQATVYLLIEDTTVPIFNESLPVDVTVGSCDAVPTAQTLTATDNCGAVGVVFEETMAEGTCAGNYTLTRTWTATDACGNETLHTQVVTVEDTTAPIFNEALPSDMILECDQEIPAAAALTASDSCGFVEVTFEESTAYGSCSGSYDLIRTWTAIDDCGNESIHTQTITVEDTTAPVFIGDLPLDIYASCDAIPEAAVLSATDNCSSEVTIVLNEYEEAGDCSNKYNLVREWIATDDCGNSSTYVQVVHLTCKIKGEDIHNAVNLDNSVYDNYFVIEGIDCFPDNMVRVFNRWGVEVYSQKGYNNEDKAFRGYSDGRATIEDSNGLPTGNYFYIIEYKYSYDGGETYEILDQSGFLYVNNNNK